VIASGMIYACLKPIAQWNTRFTVPAYVIFAIMTGSVLLDTILALMGSPDRKLQYVALIAIGLGWIWKRATWRHNDGLGPAATMNSATSLAGGQVRSVEWPHTAENYVLKEMGYRIARKHAERLGGLTQLFAFGMPFVATALASASGGGIAKVASVIAVLAQAPASWWSAGCSLPRPGTPSGFTTGSNSRVAREARTARDVIDPAHVKAPCYDCHTWSDLQ
jgi:DMSO reductase anchor subunit